MQAYPPSTHTQQPPPSAPLTPVVRSPPWIIAVRVLRFIFAIAILALSVVEEYYWDSYGNLKGTPGLGIAASVLTWVFTFYVLFTEMIPMLNVAYNVYAVTATDGILSILWLVFVAIVPRYGHDVEDFAGAVLAAFQLAFSAALLISTPFLARQQDSLPGGTGAGGGSQPYAPGSTATASQGYMANMGDAQGGGGNGGGVMEKIKSVFSLPGQDGVMMPPMTPPPVQQQQYQQQPQPHTQSPPPPQPAQVYNSQGY